MHSTRQNALAERPDLDMVHYFALVFSLNQEQGISVILTNVDPFLVGEEKTHTH